MTCIAENLLDSLHTLRSHIVNIESAIIDEYKNAPTFEVRDVLIRLYSVIFSVEQSTSKEILESSLVNDKEVVSL